MSKALLINKDGAKNSEEFNSAKSDKQPLEDSIKQILASKAPKYTEIEVSFFQACALRCSFCWQDHDDTEGVTTIREKADTVIDYLENNKGKLQPLIQVHMLGGELFEDNHDEEYYEDYLYFMEKVNDYCSKNLPDKRVLFILISNMSFKLDKTGEKIDNLVASLSNQSIEFLIATSWDPTGRPLTKELQSNFHKNILRYKKYISEVTFVLTRPTIKRILADNDKYLRQLVDMGFKIDYDYYTPTGAHELLMPSDWEILNAIRCMIKKYPSMGKLKAFTNPEEHKGIMTCASLNKITILPDGTITNCRHLNYDQESFNTKILNESNADIIMSYVTKKECLTCEYFADCPLSCFLMHDHKTFTGRQELDECLYKVVYREAGSED